MLGTPEVLLLLVFLEFKVLAWVGVTGEVAFDPLGLLMEADWDLLRVELKNPEPDIRGASEELLSRLLGLGVATLTSFEMKFGAMRPG